MKSLKNLLMLCLIFLTTHTTGIFGGDFGEGGGRPRISTIIELKASQGSIQKLIYLEELSLMGDVGEGGGGVRKWINEFQIRYSKRIEGLNVSYDLRQFEGRRFIYARKRMPEEEFGKLELKNIVAFQTKTQGLVMVHNVYNYYLKPLSVSEEKMANRSDRFSDLLYFETIEGVQIPAKDITDIQVEFRANP